MSLRAGPSLSSIALHDHPASIEPSGNQILLACRQVKPPHIPPLHSHFDVAVDLQDELPVICCRGSISSKFRSLLFHGLLNRIRNAPDLVDHLALLSESLWMPSIKIVPKLMVRGERGPSVFPCVRLLGLKAQELTGSLRRGQQPGGRTQDA